jgi:hypothetical protein
MANAHIAKPIAATINAKPINTSVEGRLLATVVVNARMISLRCFSLIRTLYSIAIVNSLPAGASPTVSFCCRLPANSCDGHHIFAVFACGMTVLDTLVDHFGHYDDANDNRCRDATPSS